MEKFMDLFERLVVATEKIADQKKWDPHYVTDPDPVGLDVGGIQEEKPAPKVEITKPDPKEVFPTYDGWSAAKVTGLCEQRGIEVRTPGASRNKPTKSLIEALKEWDRKNAPEQKEEPAAPPVPEPTPDPFAVSPPKETEPEPAPDPFAGTAATTEPVVVVSHEDVVKAAQTAMAELEKRAPGTGSGIIYNCVKSAGGVDFVKDIPEDKRLAVIQAMSEVIS